MQIQEPQYSSRVELSKSALKNNIDYIKRTFLPEGSQLSCVIKGNAYGHGINEIVQIHQEVNNIDHFSVFSSYEALLVKKALIRPASIMVIGDMSVDTMPWAIENEIEFYISDTTHLEKLIEITKNHSKKH
jgi:alanine racemase